LPTSDEFTVSLITNPEVLEVNQNSSGGHQSYHQEDTVAWTADVPAKNAKYVAVFNIGDAPQTVDLKWSDVGVVAKAPKVRDLWGRKDLGAQGNIHISLAPHASVFYKVAP
jgi:alpha-galactosidase